VQDGGYSHQLNHALPLLHPVRLARLAGRELGSHLSHQGQRLHALLHEEGDATAALLVMGRDRANGRIELARPGHRLRVRWDTPSNLELYAAETAACRELVTALGAASFALSPNWTFLGQPSAPHNLGGSRMGAHEGAGVVDPEGSVFGYPGLYVLDSAIIPDAVGVNPSHTIAAVAERCVEAAIRRLPGRERWRAPEASDVTPVALPEDRVAIPPGGTSPPPSTGGGIRWRETMKGTVDLAGTETVARFDVTIAVPDVGTFLADPTHPGRATGQVHVAGLTGPAGARIDAGTFHLFLDEGDPRARAMTYSLPFHAADDRPWILQGRKDVRGRTPLDFWRATTNLDASLVPRDGGEEEAIGRLRIGVLNVARMVASMRGVGGARRADPAVALWKFDRLFVGTLLRLLVAGRRAPAR
jgi:cholesterol oxidase